MPTPGAYIPSRKKKPAPAPAAAPAAGSRGGAAVATNSSRGGASTKLTPAQGKAYAAGVKKAPATKPAAKKATQPAGQTVEQAIWEQALAPLTPLSELHASAAGHARDATTSALQALGTDALATAPYERMSSDFAGITKGTNQELARLSDASAAQVQSTGTFLQDAAARQQADQERAARDLGGTVATAPAPNVGALTQAAATAAGDNTALQSDLTLTERGDQQRVASKSAQAALELDQKRQQVLAGRQGLEDAEYNDLLGLRTQQQGIQSNLLSGLYQSDALSTRSDKDRILKGQLARLTARTAVTTTKLKTRSAAQIHAETVGLQRELATTIDATKRAELEEKIRHNGELEQEATAQDVIDQQKADAASTSAEASKTRAAASTVSAAAAASQAKTAAKKATLAGHVTPAQIATGTSQLAKTAESYYKGLPTRTAGTSVPVKIVWPGMTGPDAGFPVEVPISAASTPGGIRAWVDEQYGAGAPQGQRVIPEGFTYAISKGKVQPSTKIASRNYQQVAKALLSSPGAARLRALGWTDEQVAAEVAKAMNGFRWDNSPNVSGPPAPAGIVKRP